jgi:pimeloyl-ACP methyl ester carboxylesterase
VSDLPALLLLPGLLNDADLWQAQLRDLADIADCQVADLTRHDDLDALVEAVLQAAPPRFALAGFSLGGWVAQHILRTAPQRVERLALIGTSYLPDTAERAASRAKQQAMVAMAGNFHGFGNSMMRRYVDASRLDDAGLLAVVRGMTMRLGAEVFLRQNQLPRLDGRDVLQGYAQPALVLCGRNDGITPVQRSREMAAMMQAVELVELPDCGHLAPLEQPVPVSAAMRRWLQR